MNTNTKISKAVAPIDTHESTLDATILSVENSIDWIIPTALILDAFILDKLPLNEVADIKKHDFKEHDFKEHDFKEHDFKKHDNKKHDIKLSENFIENYNYKGKSIPVVSLLSRGEAKTTNTLIVLEGESDDERLGLIIKGNVINQTFRVSDIKDYEQADDDMVNSSTNFKSSIRDSDSGYEDNIDKTGLKLTKLSDYILHVVKINDQKYAVPHLQKLVEQSLKR